MYQNFVIETNNRYGPSNVIMQPIGKINKKFESEIVNMFSSFSFNMCFGCSIEPSHGDSSFDYLQHVF